jgi:hypothetical protein
MASFTPRPFYPRGKCPSTHWTGGWVEFRAGLLLADYLHDLVLNPEYDGSMTLRNVGMRLLN